MSPAKYDMTEIRKVQLDQAIQQNLKADIVSDICEPMLEEIGKICDRNLSNLPNVVDEVIVIAKIQEAMEALMQWKLGEMIAYGHTMLAATECIGFQGSSSGLSRRYPRIREIAELRKTINETGGETELDVNGWRFTLYRPKFIEEELKKKSD